MEKRRLTDREVARIEKVADMIHKLRLYYWSDEETSKSKDTLLEYEDNGTVGDQLSCAAAALDTILQEYY